jgi:hypothetical protein
MQKRQNRAIPIRKACAFETTIGKVGPRFYKMDQLAATAKKSSSSTSIPDQPGDISRRDVIKTLGVGISAGILLASGKAFGETTTPGSETAAPGSTPEPDARFRTIPRSDERLPVVGLGTFMTFDSPPGQNQDDHREVVRRFWEAGGRVIDTSPLYGASEPSVGQFAAELQITNQLFVTNKIWSTGEFLADDSHAERSFQNSRLRLWRDKLM